MEKKCIVILTGSYFSYKADYLYSIVSYAFQSMNFQKDLHMQQNILISSNSLCDFLN